MKRVFLSVAVVAALLSAMHAGVALADAKPIPPDQFEALKAQIEPQPGENSFWDIPWLLSIWEARELAAKEGKPIYIWSGSQGAPITGC
ncbi:MAG: hypothetical protein WD066_16640 [Planctomycetaceae bacterium]